MCVNGRKSNLNPGFLKLEKLICKKLMRCLQNLIFSSGGFCRHEHAQTNTINAPRSPEDLAAMGGYKEILQERKN
jgi:hypothetical protein